MQTAYLISIGDLCASHHVEQSFFDLLQEYGLIEVTWDQQGRFIHADQLEAVERYIHFHYDLDINIEGIETVNHLLDKISQLQMEITGLKNRLRLYEGEAE